MSAIIDGILRWHPFTLRMSPDSFVNISNENRDRLPKLAALFKELGAQEHPMYTLINEWHAHLVSRDALNDAMVKFYRRQMNAVYVLHELDGWLPVMHVALLAAVAEQEPSSAPP